MEIEPLKMRQTAASIHQLVNIQWRENISHKNAGLNYNPGEVLPTKTATKYC
jgi:hypothetical protein